MNALNKDWIDIGLAETLPLRGSRIVPSPRGDIAVFRALYGTVFALYDRCPHKGGPLSQGIVHGRVVTCPLHSWVISLETGEAQGADKGCAHQVAVKVEGARVLLAASALTPAAA